VVSVKEDMRASGGKESRLDATHHTRLLKNRGDGDEMPSRDHGPNFVTIFSFKLISRILPLLIGCFVLGMCFVRSMETGLFRPYLLVTRHTLLYGTHSMVICTPLEASCRPSQPTGVLISRVHTRRRSELYLRRTESRPSIL
jgi:hypothetical protein